MPRPRSLLTAALLLASFFGAARCGTAAPPAAPSLVSVPPREFASLVNKLSEPGGYFPAENLVSNETSYLEVAEILADRFPKDGVYLGVGPDQSFNYIARLKPRLAFILDIRRQNMVQHLMFNAFFAQAVDPYQFLCRLYSRPCPARTPAGALASIEATLSAVEQVLPQAATLQSNETAVIRHVEGVLSFPLAEDDRRELHRIMRSFFDEQLQIRFRSSSRPSWLPLPSYRDLMVIRSPTGRYGHYLSSLEDYNYLREMERSRRIIPVVGDFAGPFALKAIGR